MNDLKTYDFSILFKPTYIIRGTLETDNINTALGFVAEQVVKTEPSLTIDSYVGIERFYGEVKSKTPFVVTCPYCNTNNNNDNCKNYQMDSSNQFCFTCNTCKDYYFVKLEQITA